MTLKREIKDAYIEGGASIYVKTHSNAVYVDNNETETLTQRLDNVKDSITKHTTQLKDIVNINVLDYGLKGDGNVEDLTQLKEILSNKTINKSILFPAGKIYKINESIDILADNCIINILGTIILDNCDGFNLQDVNNCIININKITSTTTYNPWYDYNNGKNKIDYSTFNNYAIRFNNARNNKININTIHGLKQALYLAPSQYELEGNLTASGTQYNEIHFGFLEACAYPIMFERLYGGTWANSNTFYGGMTSGYLSVYMKTGDFDGDVYNQNVFYNIGAEYCKGGGFLLEEGKENAFYEFRHDKVDNYYIKTGVSTRNNLFSTQYSGYLEGMNILGENNIVNMPNYKYSDSNDLISNKTIFMGNNKKVNKANLLKSNADNSTEAYCDNGEIPFTNFYKLIKDYNGNERVIYQFPSFTKVSSGVLNITNKNMNNTFYLNTKDSDIIVKFNESVEKIHYGHKFIFMTTGNFSADHIPVFQDKSGNIISSLTNKINEPESLYCVIYIGGEYICYKIGVRK